jgi:hypothetical protein
MFTLAATDEALLHLWRIVQTWLELLRKKYAAGG